jgi:hypothetical protein
MTLSKLARLFYRASVITRDLNAVSRHRVAKRIVNRQIGRMFGRVARKVFL